jgi:hypothetical protein
VAPSNLAASGSSVQAEGSSSPANAAECGKVNEPTPVGEQPTLQSGNKVLTFHAPSTSTNAPTHWQYNITGEYAHVYLNDRAGPEKK